MATILKPRKPITDITSTHPGMTVQSAKAAPASKSEPTGDLEGITVEKYLELQFEEMVRDFRDHTQVLITKLRDEYTKTLEEVQRAGTNRSQDSPPVVTLKAISGPHTGQKFRLESTNANGEDEFKMGRSTGRLFKEKGVSLYKDKEISTTHAKIEFKNGGVFLIDMKSTNGSQLNEEDVEESIPYKLAEGDKITMGSTVLLVHLSSLPDDA